VHYLLFYDVVEGYTERRKPFRAAHLAHANEAVARGELVLGGALADPVDAAVLLFRAPSRQPAERFAEREWTTVIGPEASLRI
jgi:uncharacterized protein YciI